MGNIKYKGPLAPDKKTKGASPTEDTQKSRDELTKMKTKFQNLLKKDKKAPEKLALLLENLLNPRQK